MMETVVANLAAASLASEDGSAPAQQPKPTGVLVHGAFADNSSWNGVVRILEKDGYVVVAASNPLRSVRSDAASVASVVKSIGTPVVLVGHSYGGSVISQAATFSDNVIALVFVAAFAAEKGETALDLAGKFPGATLGSTLAAPVPLPGGGNDLYLQKARFAEQFAADVPKDEAAVMAATQRPITEAALNEPSAAPAWKAIPSWFIYGDRDLNIPAEAQAFMAGRAKARQTVVVRGASHVVMISHADAVASLIETAASAR